MFTISYEPTAESYLEEEITNEKTLLDIIAENIDELNESTPMSDVNNFLRKRNLKTINYSHEAPKELSRLLNFIKKRNGDCESLRNGYLKHSFDSCGYTWYGDKMFCELLFCSYGTIGYSIYYKGYEIQVDNELDKIEIF